MIGLDTNVLLRVIDNRHPHHPAAVALLNRPTTNGEAAAIVPQCLYESWTAATRPVASNGLGTSPALAAQWVQTFSGRLRLLRDPADLPERWQALVREHEVVGVKAHDARLAAAYLAHGVTRLATFNARDFRRFGLDLIEPAA